MIHPEYTFRQMVWTDLIPSEYVPDIQYWERMDVELNVDEVRIRAEIK
jgi:hypothetical protein